MKLLHLLDEGRLRVDSFDRVANLHYLVEVDLELAVGGAEKSRLLHLIQLGQLLV